ncbi:hypothetical protein BGW42_005560 [Actinomortierella wolfii]|nr:hypothetical protein BGW42_005560 [Actinomortierella wolfii]
MSNQHDNVDQLDSYEDDRRSMNQETEDSTEHCVICLQPWEDKSVLETCQHAFCFKCLYQWAMLSRSCPLCVRSFDSCIHLIISDSEYTVHRFEPLEKGTSRLSQHSSYGVGSTGDSSSYGIIRQLYGPPQLRPRFRHQRRTYYYRPPPQETLEEQNVVEQRRRALEKRVHIYRHGLYVKHVGANRYSRYQQITPETFQVFPARLDRLAPWIRRELQAIAWLLRTGRGEGVGGRREARQSSTLSPSPSSSSSLGVADVNDLGSDEFAPSLELICEYIVAVMKQYDLQTDHAMDLIRGFLHEYTEHFVHELMGYARSPFSVEAYDQAVQYGSTEVLTPLRATSASQSPSLLSSGSSRSLHTDEKRNRGKRRKDILSDDEVPRSRCGGQHEASRHRSCDVNSKRDERDMSSESRKPPSLRVTFPSNESSSSEIAGPSSSATQKTRSKDIQRLIHEKLAREKAIYNSNHAL